MKRTRILNGYVAIYLPDHPAAYKSDNWKGWVYEHRVVAEEILGRPLREGEVVHHLDCDRTNNDPSNLIVLASKADHVKLHYWIDAGAKVHPEYTPKKVTYFGKPKPLCKVCGKIVNAHDREYCSDICHKVTLRKAERPKVEQLITQVKEMGFCQTGRLYGVSDNAIRKWLRSYGIDTKTLEYMN